MNNAAMPILVHINWMSPASLVGIECHIIIHILHTHVQLRCMLLLTFCLNLEMLAFLTLRGGTGRGFLFDSFLRSFLLLLLGFLGHWRCPLRDLLTKLELEVAVIPNT